MPSPGLVAIAGGKYTTYRVMGEDAVDAAAEYIPARVAPSITEKVPLMGADGYFALINQTQSVGAGYGLHPYRVRHLLDRYGSLIGEVLALAADKPELLEPITDAPVRAATRPQSGVVPTPARTARAAALVSVMTTSEVPAAYRMGSASARVRAGTTRNPPPTPRKPVSSPTPVAVTSTLTARGQSHPNPLRNEMIGSSSAVRAVDVPPA